MNKYIQELEARNNQQKGEYIKSFFQQRNIPFSVQQFKTLLARGQNIIVDYPFNKSYGGKRTLLTAHYNAWFRTPGANDNASGVSVLLGFLERLLQRPKNAQLRFIFFDLEDGWAVRGGSKVYVKEFGIADLEKVYNLEGVGMGRMLLFWPSTKTGRLKPVSQIAENLGFSVIHLPLSRIPLISFPVERGFVSDHHSFIEAGFEQAVSLTTFPKEDTPFLEPLFRGKAKLRFAFELLRYNLLGRGKVPKIMKHYHNRDDRSEFIEEQNLQDILELIWHST
ncbi:MAG: aminopeptidase [Parcubacteria group bacterium Gr01-1014_30]|nr:MAG: aminopeptidase [Parcubacteria group bacterium Gr01-1014_30]